MPEKMDIPNSSRKLFFGLFLFPLVIAVGMAVLLCSVVLMTHEKETPESLIEAIKKSSPGKRWEKAFELSNELHHAQTGIRENNVLNEIVQILQDPQTYDAKTRAYMALALSHFRSPQSAEALRGALKDSEEDVRIYALWGLGVLDVKGAAADIFLFTKSSSADERKTAAYVLGAIGDAQALDILRPLLLDPVADVRWNAALSLARLHDSSGMDVLIQMMQRAKLSADLNMEEPQIEAVMTNAAKGLALIRKPEAFKILESVSRGDKNMKVRQAALDALKFQSGKIDS